jgi:hypothetical protein
VASASNLFPAAVAAAGVDDCGDFASIEKKIQPHNRPARNHSTPTGTRHFVQLRLLDALERGRLSFSVSLSIVVADPRAVHASDRAARCPPHRFVRRDSRADPSRVRTFAQPLALQRR